MGDAPVQVHGDDVGVAEHNNQADLASHVKALYGIPSERGGTTWLEECPEYIRVPSYGSGHAILARYKEARRCQAKRLLNLCSVTIQSPDLKDVVRQVFKNYPGEAVEEHEPTFEAPFHAFVHHWATLECVRDDASNRGQVQRADQINALLQLLTDDMGDDIRDAKALATHSTAVFRHLWMLYPPGCPVIGEWQGKEHCFVVNEAKYLMAEMPPMMSLDLLLLDHDGERFGWRKVRKFIPGFDGSSAITGLPAIPLQFHYDPGGAIARLTARGKSATEYLNGSPIYKGYDGPVRLQRSFDLEEIEVFVDGRIVIDAKGHSQHANRYCPAVFTVPHRLECLLVRDPHTKLVSIEQTAQERGGLLTVMANLNFHPILSIGLPLLEPSLNDDVPESAPLTRHSWTEVLFGIKPEAFCRSAVRGYCLVSKAWAEFEIDSIAGIQWNKDAFDALVMSPPRKRLLEALVRQQQVHKADTDVDDVVKGKGQGLIMLLTGPPGTGKTLTAESIADRLQLPLYAVSASELGDSAKEIESQFGQVLRLAASWNAVLLLDEADAFLDRRVDSPEARERNKRVAAFLRILEYYKGILVLTTNRIINFDDAFYSRIHLSLPFPPLDAQSRARIWSNFTGTSIAATDVQDLSREELNGREIKNIMKMARLLAKDAGETLVLSHVHDVLAVVREDPGSRS